MKTLTATPRPYNCGKAKTLSFLHVVLGLGVKLTSLLNKTRQSYGISFEGAFFWKIENSPIRGMLYGTVMSSVNSILALTYSCVLE